MCDIRKMMTIWFGSHKKAANFALFKKIKANQEWVHKIEQYTSFLSVNATFNQRIYHYYFEIQSVPQCKCCGKELKFGIFTSPYLTYCSKACKTSVAHQTGIFNYEKQIATFRNKYVDDKNGAELLSNKKKSTLLERYGVDHPMKIPEAKNKYILNSIEKYGVDWVSKSADVKAKISNTWANTPSKKLIDIKRAENHKKSMQEKYGVDSIFAIDEYQEKRKTTLNKNYGVTVPLQSKEILDRLKTYFIKKYGADNPWKIDAIQQKCYVTAHKIKVFKTMNGTEYLYQGYTDIAIQELLTKYNENDIVTEFDCPIFSYNHDGKIKKYRPDVFVKSENLIIEIKSVFTLKRAIQQNMLKYNSVTNEYKNELWVIFPNKFTIRFTKNITNPVIQQIQKDYATYNILCANNVVYFVDYDLLLYINDINEYDNDFIFKKIKFNQQKVKFINVFSDDFINKYDIIKSRINNILGNNKKIFARKCTISVISANDGNAFLRQNHLQGSINASVYIGLFFDNKLISVMSFGKPRTFMHVSNHIADSWEMLRFSSSMGVSVVGGCGKLLKYFTKHYAWNKITTYADRNWGDGDTYTKIGFTFTKTTPRNYFYIYNEIRYHRFKFRKDKLVSMGFSPEKTENEITAEMGLLKIFDAGHNKFEMLNT